MNASKDKTGDGYIDHTAAYEAQHEAWDDRAVLRHVATELTGLRNKDGTGFYRMTRLAQATINELLAKVESHLGDDLPGPGERMPDGSHGEGNLTM